jgi:hypothetical protein
MRPAAVEAIESGHVQLRTSRWVEVPLWLPLVLFRHRSQHIHLRISLVLDSDVGFTICVDVAGQCQLIHLSTASKLRCLEVLEGGGVAD